MTDLSPEIRLYRLEDDAKRTAQDLVEFKTEIRGTLGEIQDRQEQSQKVLVSILVAIIVGVVVALVLSAGGLK